MKIFIFETEHFESLYPLIRLFDLPGNHITIFTNENCRLQATALLGEDAAGCQWIIQRNESKVAFTRLMYRFTRKHKPDIFLLNTVSNNFIFYGLMVRLLPGVRFVLTLHDINTWFTHQWKWSLRRMIRITGKKMLLASISEFNVIAQPMKPYLEARLPAHKKVYCLPGAVFEPHRLPEKNYSLPLEVVVPGSIDGKRRDYDLVLAVVEQCEKARVPMTVTLLGSACGDYGEKIINQARLFSGEYVKLLVYPDPLVPQLEFERVMNRAHLVFSPMCLETEMMDGIEETYGVSKSSGVVFDVVRHAVPFMVPSGLIVDEPLARSCIRYDSLEDIVGHLRNLTNGSESWTDLRENAVTASMFYSVQEIRKRNAGIFTAF